MSDDTSAPDDGESHPTESVWMSTTDPTSYPALDGDDEADVVVVGGGITGLTAATKLSEEGADVAVVESGRIVEGVTGRTTAKLTLQHGLIYDHLRSEFGTETARRYADANQEAIETVRDRVERYDIDCDFDRTPAYTYTESAERRGDIEDEVDAARALDIPAEFVEETPLPFDVEAAIRVEDQARFHPRKYLLALAEAVVDAGNDIYEETAATDIESGDRPRVVTERGTLTADAVVVATHYPILERRLFFSRLYPHRSYVVTIRTDDAPTEGMYYRAEEPERTIRTKVAGDENLLIVGGEGHKTGQADSEERYERLERYAREQFEVESMPYRWSTQDFGTPDRIPYVGSAGPGTANVYVGTGFGGWGMTNGTAAGELLADLALGRSNPYVSVYDPTRVSKSGAKKAIKENVEVGKEFVEGWAEGLLSSGTVTPPAGEARVVRHDGKPYGLYRDEDGALHAVSAVCTHMDCIVEWNSAEKSWDCPCHGSRFDTHGDVLNGPAVEGLSTPDSRE